MESGFIRNFQILRLLRLFKLVRAVRKVPALQLVWRMVRSFLVSGPLLLWAVIDFLFLNFLFSIFFVVLIGHLDAVIHDDTVFDLFGNPMRAILTSIQISTITHWSAVVRSVKDKAPAVVPIAVLTILIANFVLLNIVTAVVIENVFHLSKIDEEMLARAKEQKRIQQWKLLKRIFKEIDLDGSGNVTIDELDDALANNNQLARKLNEIGMDKQELSDLWVILDTSGDGELDIDEFVDGIRQMEGPAKSYDMIKACTR